MADPDKKAGRAAVVILLIALGLIVVMWLAWDTIREQIRQDGMEARVQPNAALPVEPPEVLPPTTNPTGQTGGTPADETPPPDERPESNND
ncbi:MAG: hypothetical protein V7678_12875 [Brevundimonas sp.]